MMMVDADQPKGLQSPHVKSTEVGVTNVYIVSADTGDRGHGFSPATAVSPQNPDAQPIRTVSAFPLATA